MDFLVSHSPKCANGEFQFSAVSEAAKKFTAERMGSGAVGFSLDRNHFGSAIKAIIGENLTVQIRTPKPEAFRIHRPQ